MDVEIIDKRLVVTPTTHDDVRLIYAIAATWTAFDAVICPVSGEPIRCNEDGAAESAKSARNPRLGEAGRNGGKDGEMRGIR